VDMEEYVQIMREMMEESQMMAQAVAFEQAGYETEITAEGVEVVNILPESRGRDLLVEGDVIVGVDGREIDLAREVVDRVQAREIGEIVELEILRGEDRITLEVPTVEHTEEPGKAAIGVLIRSYNLQYDLPFEVKIDTRDIIGPSAGVMFSLEILNQILEEDITRGRRIAGTGTINLEEEIGPISGVRHKILAAERDGADAFIIPTANRDEIEGMQQLEEMNILEVANMEEVLQRLGNARENALLGSPTAAWAWAGSIYRGLELRGGGG